VRLNLHDKLLPRWLGITLMLVIAIDFGGNHIAARLAFDHGVNVTTAVAVRSAGTALAVLPLLLAFRVPLALPAATLYRALAIGAVLSVQSYCLYSSVARIPAALALLVFNTHPMMLTLLSWAAGVERPAPRALGAMPVALIGLALALDLEGSGSFAGRWAEIGAGVGFAFAAAVSFATAMFLSARWLKGVDGRLRSCLTMGTIAVLALASGALTDTLALPADGIGWLGLALLTLFYGSAITALFMVLPRLASASDIAVLNFEPIAVLFVAWMLLDQKVAPMQIAGALIVVASIVALGSGKR
jgi:drug/metabolite transporter (DMT)-like permease